MGMIASWPWARYTIMVCFSVHAYMFVCLRSHKVVTYVATSWLMKFSNWMQNPDLCCSFINMLDMSHLLIATPRIRPGVPCMFDPPVEGLRCHCDRIGDIQHHHQHPSASMFCLGRESQRPPGKEWSMLRLGLCGKPWLWQSVRKHLSRSGAITYQIHIQIKSYIFIYYIIAAASNKNIVSQLGSTSDLSSQSDCHKRIVMCGFSDQFRRVVTLMITDDAQREH